MGRGTWKAGWDVEGFKLHCLLSCNSVFRTVNVRPSNTVLAVALSVMVEMFSAVQHGSR